MFQMLWLAAQKIPHKAPFTLMNSLHPKVWSQAFRLRNPILLSLFKVALSPLRGKPDLIKFMGTECLFIIIWWEAGMWEAKLLEGFMESVEAEYRTEMILKWISQRKVL